MGILSDESLRRYWTDDSLPADERQRIENDVAADPETVRRFEQLAEEALRDALHGPPPGVPFVSHPLAMFQTARQGRAPRAADTDLADVDPALRATVRQASARERAAEHWALIPAGDASFARLATDRQVVPGNLTRRVGPEISADTWAEDPPPLPVTVERAATEPLTLRLAARDWPPGYDLICLQLIQWMGPQREPLAAAGTVERLQAAIDGRALPPAPADERPVTPDHVLAADTPLPPAAPAVRAGPSSPADLKSRGFLMHADLWSGCVSVRAAMPLDRRTEMIAAELAYDRHDGTRAQLRRLVTLTPDRDNRRWSLWQSIAVPELMDQASARVTLRCRSLAAQDVPRLSRDQWGALSRCCPPIPIVAEPEPPGFVFRVRRPSQLAAVQDQGAGWVLQVAHG